jgi:hypothetical protein
MYPENKVNQILKIRRFCRNEENCLKPVVEIVDQNEESCSKRVTEFVDRNEENCSKQVVEFVDQNEEMLLRFDPYEHFEERMGLLMDFLDQILKIVLIEEH